MKLYSTCVVLFVGDIAPWKCPTSASTNEEAKTDVNTEIKLEVIKRLENGAWPCVKHRVQHIHHPLLTWPFSSLHLPNVSLSSYRKQQCINEYIILIYNIHSVTFTVFHYWIAISICMRTCYNTVSMLGGTLGRLEMEPPFYYGNLSSSILNCSYKFPLL